MSFLPATALIWSGKCSETVGTIWKAGILEKAIYGYTLTSETTKSMAYSMLVWTSCLIWQMSLNIWIFGSTSRKIFNQISTCPNIYHESTISSITRPTNKMTIAMETGQWSADSRKWRSAKTLDEGPRIHSTNPPSFSTLLYSNQIQSKITPITNLSQKYLKSQKTPCINERNHTSHQFRSSNRFSKCILQSSIGWLTMLSPPPTMKRNKLSWLPLNITSLSL